MYRTKVCTELNRIRFEAWDVPTYVVRLPIHSCFTRYSSRVLALGTHAVRGTLQSFVSSHPYVEKVVASKQETYASVPSGARRGLILDRTGYIFGAIDALGMSQHLLGVTHGLGSCTDPRYEHRL